jgi:hypothetical protein
MVSISQNDSGPGGGRKTNTQPPRLGVENDASLYRFHPEAILQNATHLSINAVCFEEMKNQAPHQFIIGSFEARSLFLKIHQQSIEETRLEFIAAIWSLT